MSIYVTNATEKLSAEVLQDVQMRVDRVRGFLKQSTTAWLSIAREFATAKDLLSQFAYERFVNDVGFTKSVADKLIVVGKKKSLFEQPKLDFIAGTDSWTVLYELSKLEDKQIEQVIDLLKSEASKRLTRELIYNIANNRPSDEKVIVLASIEMSSTKLKTITRAQSSMIAASSHRSIRCCPGRVHLSRIASAIAGSAKWKKLLKLTLLSAPSKPRSLPNRDTCTQALCWREPARAFELAFLFSQWSAIGQTIIRSWV